MKYPPPFTLSPVLSLSEGEVEGPGKMKYPPFALSEVEGSSK